MNDNDMKLWRDMTPEEKGALLLAHHEKPGSVEFWSVNEWAVLKNFGWHDERAYRIKPQPKVETVKLYGDLDRSWNANYRRSDDSYSVTLTFRDGKVYPVAQVEEL